MQTTFILAGHFGVTPFEIMSQDLEMVIMVVNYLVDSGKANANDNNTSIIGSEKERDKDFWACL